MKLVLIVLVLVGMTLADEERVARLAAKLNATPLNNYIYFLPKSLRDQITKRQTSPSQGAQHWCCKVDNGTPKIIEKTRNQILYEKVSISVTTGYQGCGLWGTGRCEHKTARYHQQVRYGVRYLQAPLFDDCPSQHVVCCAQYHLVNGNCLHTTSLIEHTNTLETLAGLGFLGENQS